MSQRPLRGRGCVFFLLWPRAGAQRELLLPLPFPGAEAKKKTPWVVFFFFALAPCRRPTGLLLPLPFPGAAAKKNTPWVVFFFCSGPVPARGFSFPCHSPGPEQKTTPWVVFSFALAPPKGRGDAQRSATKKKQTLHTRGRQQKKF